MGVLDLPLGQKMALFVALPVASLLLYYLLKKSNEEEDEMRPRIVTSRQTVIEVKVPRHMTGSIIGARGARIKEVQDATGARIQFKDDTSSDTERICVIRGTEETAQRAEMIVRRMIAEEPPIVESTITVPARCVGRIIGRGGEVIRQLCRTSKARIQVPSSEEKTQDGLRVINLTGSPYAVSVAKSLIQEKVQEEEAFRNRSAINAANRPERGPRRKPEGADHHQDTNAPREESAQPEMEANGSEDNAQPKETVTTPPQEWPCHRNDYLDIYVSAVESPGHFWVQIISSKSPLLDQLMEDMTRYYTELEGVHRTVENPQVGDLLAAPFDHDHNWYRVRVVEVSGDSDTVDLYYVDFGDNCYRKKRELRELRGDFLSLPLQAVEVCLAHVKPKGEEWSDEAVELFEDLTYMAKWKVIQAKTSSYTLVDNESTPCLVLVDTSGPQDVDIGQVLIERGLAEYLPENGDGDASNSSTQLLPQKPTRNTDLLFASIQHGCDN